MGLIKLTDYEGETHYINTRYIISVRPFVTFDLDKRNCKVEYGTGFVDCIYMEEQAKDVASFISSKDVANFPTRGYSI